MLSLVFGWLCGFTLSYMRAPQGWTLFELPAVAPTTAMAVRAAGLSLVAMGLLARGRAALNPALLLAAALGFATHAYLLAPLLAPPSVLSMVGTGVLAAVGLWWLARAQARCAELCEDHPSASFAELLGLAIAGVGSAFGLELLARHLRLHGGQLADDDSHFALTLLLLLGLGAAAFGWLGDWPRWKRSATALSVAMAGAALYAALWMLTRTSAPIQAREYLQTFGLDLSQHGTLPYDALLAASMFVLPAFALGTALHVAQDGQRRFALLLGAAVGLICLPSLFSEQAAAASSDKQTFAAQWLPLAAILTSGGAVLALLVEKTASTPLRWIQLLLGLSTLAPALLVNASAQHVLAPWSRTPVAPYQLRETPGGLLTIEGPLLPDSMSGNIKQLTLERRVLVPGLEGIPDELSMLQASLELLSPEQRAAGGLRVLLVGQLTSLRARMLSEAGVQSIDRCASWWPSMESIEQEYFGDTPRPAGAILRPEQASANLKQGVYALVIVPPVRGDPPVIPSLELPSSTTLVLWLDSAASLPRGSQESWWYYAPSKIDNPLLALVLHPRAKDLSLFQMQLPRAARPLSWLFQRNSERLSKTRAQNFQRLASAMKSPLGDGLAQLYSAQSLSSPFESPAESFELPKSALDKLREATLSERDRPLTNGVRVLWEELGLVLAGKRWIPEIYEYLEPLAQARAPWPGLERQLALADAESLEFESAYARLLPLQDYFAKRGDFWRELAKVQEQLGKADDCIWSYRKALGLRPGDHDLERRLAILLVRAGDPEGKPMVEKLLGEHPDDEELRIYAGPGPYPPPKPGYSPQGDRHDH